MFCTCRTNQQHVKVGLRVRIDMRKPDSERLPAKQLREMVLLVGAYPLSTHCDRFYYHPCLWCSSVQEYEKRELAPGIEHLSFPADPVGASSLLGETHDYKKNVFY